MTQTLNFTLRQRNSTNSLYDLETSKMTDINGMFMGGLLKL